MKESIRHTDVLPRVVIVGGGFGGIEAARALAKAPVRVTLVDRTNHYLFQPLLYQVATAGLSPADIAAPIRSILGAQRNTEVLMAEVTGVDTERRRLLSTAGPIPYDYLVLATGSRFNYFGHDAWERFAPNLKTITDATEIRQQILLAFEAAELEPDPERQKALLTFVLVGAGPTGVEMAGAIAELARRALARDFRRIAPESARILLVEAAPRILGAFPEDLADAAKRELERHGVEVMTDTKVDQVDAEGVVVSGEHIASATVLWTAGVVATPVGEWLGAEKDRGGRVKVREDLSVPGLPEVYVVGDAAYVEHEGKPLPGVAPVAMQEGRYVGALIAGHAKGPQPEPFRYHDKGNLATVGRSFAILHRGRLKLSGFPAWLLWLVIHIWYLIGFRNRLLVMIQWAWAYITFQRGARLITRATPPRVAGAPGDLAQAQDAPAERMRKAS